MSKSAEMARAELVQAVHRAARIERAKAVRALLRKLFRPEREERSWPVSVQPTAGDCR
ncbi:MAG: hypothetical protein WAN86_02925 [Hyphomicrobiaceae bacterium]